MTGARVESRDRVSPAARLAAPVLRTAAFRDALLRWFEQHRRVLPWRDRPDPYAIWVSEVMLQQTRVAAVQPYFDRWMRALPTLGALARAELGDVLRLWQGLGYYARARTLHCAAREIAARGGKIPESRAALRALPGFGPYTAAAVASIAFGEAVGAVDGNVARVLSRLTELHEEIESPRARVWLQHEADRLVAPLRPGEFNQAMMELGALVCLPRAPRCAECPVGAHCRARRAGVETLLPRRRPHKRPTELALVGIAVSDRRGRWLVARRRPDGLFGGLWEFPLLGAPWPALDELGPGSLDAFCEVAHDLTHRRIRVSLRRGRVDGLPAAPPPGYDDIRRVTPAALRLLPVSSLMRTLMERVGALGPK